MAWRLDARTLGVSVVDATSAKPCKGEGGGEEENVHNPSEESIFRWPQELLGVFEASLRAAAPGLVRQLFVICVSHAAYALCVETRIAACLHDVAAERRNEELARAQREGRCRYLCPYDVVFTLPPHRLKRRKP